MRGKYLALVSIFLIAIGIVSVQADNNEYHYLSICDSRCDLTNRLTPFADSCDDCCRVRGFRKGKCKGFGWQYCACKPQGIIRSLFNNILSSNNNHQNHGLNNAFQG